jgi:cobyrinic acid a,c-diamide synthase
VSRILVVAGTASGVGKTTLTVGLLEAYRRRGLAVQAFKVGPDFIDPGFHALATGRPSYTLDGWMCGREHALATVARHAAEADLAIVEGVMGCFDGADATGDAGSTAEIAKWLGAPVLLVIDASAQSRSAAAAVQGFEHFDPDLRVAAVVANRVGGAGHAGWVAEAIRSACRAVPVGALIRDETLAVPERHLGLVTAGEGVLTGARRKRLAAAIEQGIDLDRLLALAAPVALPHSAPAVDPAPRARIGVARDVAFHFYYPENLDRLRAAGAALVEVSPLVDRDLPDVDGLYLGGGYPELHAAALAKNVPMIGAVADFAASDRPIYAECGGLMYLAHALEDPQGVVHPMVGLLPTTVRMRPGRLALGYTEIRLTADSALGPAGTVARGHEFHASTVDPVPARVPRTYQVAGRAGGERSEGYVVGSALMSYVHLHFGSAPGLAPAFVQSCLRARRPEC